MDTAFSNQVVGKIDILKEMALKLNSNFKKDIHLAYSSLPNDLCKFHSLNAFLPLGKRWKICPSSSVKHSFVPLASHTLHAMFNKRFNIDVDLEKKGSIISRLFGTYFGRTRKVGLLAETHNFTILEKLGYNDEQVAERLSEYIEDDSKNDPHYIFRQTILTDGFELQIQVLDIRGNYWLY
jgi:hypothetical protein